MDDGVGVNNAFLRCLRFQICVRRVTHVVFAVRMMYIAVVDLLCVYLRGVCVVAGFATVVVMGICKCLMGSDHVFRALRAGCVCTDA